MSLNKIHLAGYGLALAIIAYLIFNPRVEEVPIEYEEDKSKRDTTTFVETVTDTVPVYDTTDVSLDIPEPVETDSEDSLKTYTTNYSDDFITARITSKVRGYLQSQDLWYVRRIQRIETENTVTTTVDRFYKPKKVFLDDQQPNRALWIGGQLEGKSFTPNISYQNDNIMYEVGYNLNDNSLQQFQLEALRLGAKIRL